MALFEKYLRNQPFTEADKAEMLATYRECSDDELWLSRRDLAQEWGSAIQRFPGLRPDERYGNHPQEYRIRAIEILAALLDSVLKERGLHTAELPAPPVQPATTHKEATAIHAAPALTVKAKRGPKPNLEGAKAVAEIVARVAGSAPWKEKLNEICDALDEAGIPVPNSWPRRETRLTTWEDAAFDDRGLARKAIGYRLKITR